MRKKIKIGLDFFNFDYILKNVRLKKKERLNFFLIESFHLIHQSEIGSLSD